MRNIKEELVVELTELDMKRFKLSQFLKSHETENVSHEQWKAMCEQLDAMNAYAKALGRRINLL